MTASFARGAAQRLLGNFTEARVASRRTGALWRARPNLQTQRRPTRPAQRRTGPTNRREQPAAKLGRRPEKRRNPSRTNRARRSVWERVGVIIDTAFHYSSTPTLQVTRWAQEYRLQGVRQAGFRSIKTLSSVAAPQPLGSEALGRLLAFFCDFFRRYKFGCSSARSQRVGPQPFVRGDHPL